MNHELEIHNLAARGQLVQGPLRSGVSIQKEVLDDFEADALWEWLDYNNIDARAVLKYLDSFFKAVGG